MGNLSSINFQKSSDHNLVHNDRSVSPSYLLSDRGLGVVVNRSAYDASLYFNQLLNKASKAYTERTGQRLQARSYKWSAVVNIKADTSMEDLKKLAKHFEEKYGIQSYQIAIHRDEGHIDQKTGKNIINHHAHLEFLTLDKNGVNQSRNFNKKTLSQMQTEVAEILQMQRGKEGSKKQRLEHNQFRQVAQEKEQLENEKNLALERVVFLQKELDAFKRLDAKKLTKKSVSEQIERVRKKLKNSGLDAKDFRALSALKKASYDSQTELDDALNEFLSAIADKITKKDQEKRLQKTVINQRNYKEITDDRTAENTIADTVCISDTITLFELCQWSHTGVNSERENHLLQVPLHGDFKDRQSHEHQRVSGLLAQRTAELESVNKALASQEKKIAVLKHDISTLKAAKDSEISLLTALALSRDKEVTALKAQLETSHISSKTAQNELSQLKTSLSTSNKTIALYEQKLGVYEQKISKHADELSALVLSRDKEISALAATNKSLVERIEKLSKMLKSVINASLALITQKLTKKVQQIKPRESEPKAQVEQIDIAKLTSDLVSGFNSLMKTKTKTGEMSKASLQDDIKAAFDDFLSPKKTNNSQINKGISKISRR